MESGTALVRGKGNPVTLVYAICSLVSQSLIAVYYVVYTLATSPTLQFIAQSAVLYVVDLLTLSGPVCLFITRYAR